MPPESALRSTNDDKASNIVSFNINHYVFVKLTEQGLKIAIEKAIPVPPEDQCGWSRWQLWCLMKAFGDHCYNGCEIPFETTIRIEIPADKTISTLNSARDADHCDYPDCEQHNALIIENLKSALAAKQAKIDALMLEFCPGEMSAEQKPDWAKHQSR
jgi:hypothetical protein